MNPVHAEEHPSGLILQGINERSCQWITDPDTEDGSEFVFSKQEGKKNRQRHLDAEGGRHPDKDAQSKSLGNFIRSAPKA